MDLNESPALTFAKALNIFSEPTERMDLFNYNDELKLMRVCNSDSPFCPKEYFKAG